MGRKGWFQSVKKAMSSDCKDQNDQGPSKSKKKWFGKKKDPVPKQEEAGAENAATSTTATSTDYTASVQPQPVSAPVPPLKEKEKETEEMQKQHTSSIAIATAKATEAAMAAAEAAAELARLTNTPSPRFPNEEEAAIRIQNAFRGYTARRALSVLRGLARLKTLMHGPSIKRQTANALKCMQTLVRVQSEIQARRLRTTEENQARQRQLLEKHGKELDKLQNLEPNEDGWNASSKTKEQIQGRAQSKHEAALRRERALAYSFNHQRTWRNPTTTKAAQTMFVESSSNPHWGWSWLERWLAARPWENAAPSNPDLAPLRTKAAPSGSQIAKALLHHVKEKPWSATSSPRSSVPSPKKRPSMATGRLSTSSTPRARPWAPSPSRWRRRGPDSEDAVSVQSEQQSRRPDFDSESLASGPSYMAPTESARARSRSRSRLGSPNSASSTNRRLSYPSSPTASRRSTSSLTDPNSVGDAK